MAACLVAYDLCLSATISSLVLSEPFIRPLLGSFVTFCETCRLYVHGYITLQIGKQRGARFNVNVILSIVIFEHTLENSQL